MFKRIFKGIYGEKKLRSDFVMVTRLGIRNVFAVFLDRDHFCLPGMVG